MKTKSRPKKLIFASLLFAVGVNVAIASEFCDGFKEGYKTGYKQAQESSLNPLVPLCPLKPLKGFGDPKSDFEYGYTIGFKQGTIKGSFPL